MDPIKLAVGLGRLTRVNWRRARRFCRREGLLRFALASSARVRQRLFQRPTGPPELGHTETSFDARLGVDTTGGSWLLSLAGIVGPGWVHGNWHEASQEGVFHALLAELPIPHRDFVFVDLGCGKGKALLMAAEYPFCRIIGVEYSEPLYQVAERNVAVYRGKRADCPQISLVLGDAAAFAPPPEPTVFYLYNPFDRTVMEPVVANILRSLRETPRQVFLVYHNALCADVLVAHGFREVGHLGDRGLNVVFEAPSPRGCCSTSS